MELLSNILPYLQIIVAIVMTAGILLQQSEAGLGAGFGGSGGGGIKHVRRGTEKWLFYGTIVGAILFVFLTLVALLI
jgi:protein translocase SecG subunit